GRGTFESIGIETPAVTAEAVEEDPDGLRVRLYPGERPRVHDVVAIGNPDLYAGLFADDAPLTFAEPIEETALIGAGSTHHVAFRVAGTVEQEQWLGHLVELGLRPAPVQERVYFRSIYLDRKSTRLNSSHVK